MEGNQSGPANQEIQQEEYESLSYEEIRAQYESQRKEREEQEKAQMIQAMREFKLQKAQNIPHTSAFPPKYVPPHKQGNHGARYSEPPRIPHHQIGNQYRQPNRPPYVPTQHPNNYPPPGQRHVPQQKKV